MTLAIVGAGAFGCALAAAYGAGRPVALWSRGVPRLASAPPPPQVRLTRDLDEALSDAQAVLMAVPTQALAAFLNENRGKLTGRRLVACCKGIDAASGLGPASLMARLVPGAVAAILTGPAFAADVAAGLPTAMTLACADATEGEGLQVLLSTPALRIYRTTDVVGAELGGALKNVVAIGSGVVIGAGLGLSARAALMTRGYAEMRRLALEAGALPETLAGLSGLGDLVLTCTSDQSRNYRFGLALGSGSAFDPGQTVEGRATSIALAARHGQDLPVTVAVAGLLEGRATLADTVQTLMTRPLKAE